MDAVYPMVYPSHFNAGEYGLADPNANPGQTVTDALLYFERRCAARARASCRGSRTSPSAARTPRADLRAQVDAARSIETHGFLLWNPVGALHVAARSQARSVPTLPIA